MYGRAGTAIGSVVVGGALFGIDAAWPALMAAVALLLGLAMSELLRRSR